MCCWHPPRMLHAAVLWLQVTRNVSVVGGHTYQRLSNLTKSGAMCIISPQDVVQGAMCLSVYLLVSAHAVCCHMCRNAIGVPWSCCCRRTGPYRTCNSNWQQQQQHSSTRRQQQQTRRQPWLQQTQVQQHYRRPCGRLAMQPPPNWQQCSSSMRQQWLLCRRSWQTGSSICWQHLNKCWTSPHSLRFCSSSSSSVVQQQPLQRTVMLMAACP